MVANITIIKKIAAEYSFWIKTGTEKDTAQAPDDYREMNELVTMSHNEYSRKIQIQIVDDKEVEPDESFTIQLLHEETLEKLDGDDTECVVTIVDDVSDVEWIGFSDRTV